MPSEWSAAARIGLGGRVKGRSHAQIAAGMLYHSSRPIHLSLTDLDAERGKQAVGT